MDSAQFKASQAQWRKWYNFLSGSEKWLNIRGHEISGREMLDWRFLNHGYEPIAAGDVAPMLRPEDEAGRSSLQLYHHLATKTPLEGKDVLEVGSGRGGGSSYVARYHRPRRMIGMDLAENAVEFSRRAHKAPGLSYQVGDALNLPFADRSFDAVLNVESSHCYDSIDTFASELKRVLRPGGLVLLTDLRPAQDMPELGRAFEAAGFRIASTQDITANVVRAIDRRSQDATNINAFLKSKALLSAWQTLVTEETAETFAGTAEDFFVTPSSKTYRCLVEREVLYWTFVMSAPA